MHEATMGQDQHSFDGVHWSPINLVLWCCSDRCLISHFYDLESEPMKTCESPWRFPALPIAVSLSNERVNFRHRPCLKVDPSFGCFKVWAFCFMRLTSPYHRGCSSKGPKQASQLDESWLTNLHSEKVQQVGSPQETPSRHGSTGWSTGPIHWSECTWLRATVVIRWSPDDLNCS